MKPAQPRPRARAYVDRCRERSDRLKEDIGDSGETLRPQAEEILALSSLASGLGGAFPKARRCFEAS
jgi:hypothetical protein